MIVSRVIDEDVVDARRPAENDLPTAEEAADHDLFLEGLRREGQKRIFPQRPRDAASRGPVVGGAGCRREHRSPFADRSHLPHLANPILKDRHRHVLSKHLCTLWPASVAERTKDVAFLEDAASLST